MNYYKERGALGLLIAEKNVTHEKCMKKIGKALSLL
jgi:hypothetical protein